MVITVGCRVIVRLKGFSSDAKKQNVHGTVRYVGAAGTHDNWVGLELDAPLGKHDGKARDGKYYFRCKANHGVYARPWAVRVIRLAPRSKGKLSVQQVCDAISSFHEAEALHQIGVVLDARLEALSLQESSSRAKQTLRRHLRKFSSTKNLNLNGLAEHRQTGTTGPPFKGSTIASTDSDGAKIALKFDKVTREIITTEEDYVRDLNTMIRAYLQGLVDENIYTNRASAKVLFSNAETLRDLNEQMLEDLKAGDDTVGAVLGRYAPFLKLYKTYAADFHSSMQELQRLHRDHRFQEFSKRLIEDKSENGVRGLSLSSYLIMPIQRVPRYALLLKEMLKNMKKLESVSNVDKDLSRATAAIKEEVLSINNALDAIEETCAVIDKNVGEDQLRRLTTDVLRKLKSSNPRCFAAVKPLMHNGRHLIRIGELTRYTSKGMKKIQTFWLFNDLLIYGDMNSAGMTVEPMEEPYTMHKLIKYLSLRWRIAN